MNMDAIIRLIDQRDYDAGDCALRARLKADPHDAEAHFVRACLLYTAEAYEPAAVHIKAALSSVDRSNPAIVPLLLQAGDNALSLGQQAAALNYFHQSYALAPDDMVAGQRLYRELRLLNDPRAAIVMNHRQQSISHLPAAQQASLFYSLANELASFEDAQAEALLATAKGLASDAALQSAICGEQIGLALLKEQAAGSLIGEFLEALQPEQRREAQQLLEPLPLSALPGNHVTVMITTNLTKKLVVNHTKAPPQATLLRETLESFKAVLQPGAGTKLVIYYDAPQDLNDPDHLLYLSALGRLATEYSAELQVRQNRGLRQNYIEAVTNCDTPYFMLLEHDWLFDRTLPTLTQLTATMVAHPFIHLLRFNKSHIVASRQDHTLRRDNRVQTMPMLHTSSFSNNPNLARTGFLQQRVLPLIAHNTSYDDFNGGAGGIEEIICAHLDRLQSHYGFTLTHRWSGCYVYGQENDPPRLTHTGI